MVIELPLAAQRALIELTEALRVVNQAAGLTPSIDPEIEREALWRAYTDKFGFTEAQVTAWVTARVATQRLM